ncbi:BlaI/MecI/CopY family transcriptional regulator [Dyadobacter jiangsuensis]|uniref:BlaI/MecI/CopY family transcriptional regulator n=1 Tax=Dyadobacter fermentans TaxID=94254 RepID=UPI001CBC0AEB|nr:BlaI/MecI/CopY family transcriptional regulator [Dyadobacter fermentans]MBZ1360777.1 BlaI/MecI/CopY family transcriptional regulator [Dyadobacter fermentans]
MEPITHSEENIMRILWELGEGVVHDIIEKLPDPKPPYTTVSSIVRLLEKKGFIDHKAYGKTYVYFPAVTREQYARRSFSDLMKHYFQGSPKNVVSFMMEENTLKPNEIDDLKQLIDSYYPKS